ncbi:thioesterase II family protein [Sorangium sp. So ce1182]|uniref:thioesterase II family protein n=1 Tax=Sorangium sp. So ce1182 TaxID=3133334 RepID=UPI003F5DE50C
MKPISEAWFWRPRPVARPRARLFCFPYAGANATTFRTWPADLPPDVELCVAQLPGRGPRLREASFNRIEPLIEALGQALEPSSVPFALFGHSMGGLVAFMLCRWLRARGWPAPAHLFVSSRCAPQLPDSFPPAPELTDAYLLGRIRRYGATPAEILAEPEVLALLLPIFRADFTLIGAYRHTPEEPLESPLTVFGGTNDTVTRPELEGWREHTRGPFALRLFEGGHFFLHTAQAALVREVVQAMPRGASDRRIQVE